MRALSFGVLFAVLTVSVHAQSAFEYFFKPRPIQMNTALDGGGAPPIWEVKPLASVPAFKVVESTRQDAKLDVSMLASAGAGITLQRSVQKEGKNYSTFGFSSFVLITGDTSKDETFDLAVAISLGFLNNLIQVGVGYDMGTVPDGRDRFFGLLSLGINITNN